MTLAERMLLVFEGSKVAHGTTTVGRVGRNGKAEADSRIVREPLTLEKMQDHIDGKQGVGSIPINEDNNCKWGALDIDIYDMDHNALNSRISKLGLPLMHCRSKSGGAHLYLFLEEYEQASIVREYLLEMAVALGHSGCEIFPKQDKILSERGDVGNFLNLPYFNAEFPQRYCFDKNVEAMELDAFIEAIGKHTIPVSGLEKLKFSGTRKYFTDGPPCLEHLFSGGAVGDDRNKKLFNCGVYCRQKHGDNWKKEMESMNRQLFSPPLEAKEVLNLEKSLEKKEYFYTCEQEPFKSFCDKELCMSRKHGIGEQGAESPEMGNLLIIMSDPRLYFLTVAGKRVQLTTDQLQNQNLFQRACMEQILILPPSVRAPKWQSTVQKLLVDASRQEVPEELTLRGQFMELLKQYCSSRIKAQHPEEILMGKPWTDNHNYTMFTISGLMDFLHRRKFEHYTRAHVQEHLKRLNDNKECHGHKAINKADGSRTTVRVWWVPSFGNYEVALKVEDMKDDETPF